MSVSSPGVKTEKIDKGRIWGASRDIWGVFLEIHQEKPRAKNLRKTQNNLTNAIAVIDGILDGSLSDQNANVAVFRQQYSDEELNALRGSLQTARFLQR